MNIWVGRLYILYYITHAKNFSSCYGFTEYEKQIVCCIMLVINNYNTYL